MSCPSETTLLRYLDEELEPDSRRSFESHLVGCRSCRTRIVELGDEAQLLADTLLERPRTARAPQSTAAPTPAMTLGLPLAIAAVTLALAVLGFLVEARLPGAFDLLHPRRLVGASEMVFNMFFLLRDKAPGLIELALSLGVVAAVSALGTFAVGMVYRRMFGPTALALAAALLVQAPDPALALERAFDREVRVAAGETIEDSLLASADEVHIAGTIHGDLIVAAENVTISGTISGNLYVLGKRTEITGTVEGVVHALAENLRIDGRIGGTVYAVGEDLTLGPDGRIGGDYAGIGQSTILDGEIGRDAHLFWGERVEVRGAIARNLWSVMSERILLRSSARIGGNVRADVEREDVLTQEDGALVGGDVQVKEVDYAHDHYLAAYRNPAFYGWHVIGFAAAFVFGLLLHAVWPRVFEGRLTTGRDFIGSLGWGFVFLVVTPLAILVTALTLVGLPLAVLALFVFVTALYTAELLVGALIGRAILPPADSSTFAFGRSFGVGLGLLTIASHVPFLGPPVGIVCLLVGLGMLAEHARRLPLLRGA